MRSSPAGVSAWGSRNPAAWRPSGPPGRAGSLARSGARHQQEPGAHAQPSRGLAPGPLAAPPCGEPKTGRVAREMPGTRHLVGPSAVWTRSSLRRLHFLLEKYGPPANITIQYNGSCHLIQWDNPETRFEIASHMLCYELEIQSEVGTAPLGEATRAPPHAGCPGEPSARPENATPPPEAPRIALSPCLCRGFRGEGRADCSLFRHVISVRQLEPLLRGRRCDSQTFPG